MKKTSLLIILSISVVNIYSQNRAGILVDYVPAPGQHINIEHIGTPQAALKMTENYSSIVSLGSFGGYIILKFEKSCTNHPQNPYGIDFTVFGNSFSGSSEPGVVWVMKDDNLNGLPDDTWYEISGSNHFFSGTVKNYQVSYFKTTSRNVYWKDNKTDAGWITANEFNLQEYYPSQVHFPEYPSDSVTFKGTLLESNYFITKSQEIRVELPAFGYADCRPRIQGIDLSLPDNPYTSVTEGAGGDPIDISWATDSMGNYIELDSIHFVKIVSANLNVAGWLGDISTDIAWIEDVNPHPGISGKENMIVFKPLPAKILRGDSLQLETFYFDRGRKTNSPVQIHSLNDEVAKILPSGNLVGNAVGESRILFSANNESNFTWIKVIIPESIQFITDFSGVYPGDTLELAAEIFDNEQEKLIMQPEFSSSDSLAGKIIRKNGRYFFVAVQPGELTLTAFIEEFRLEKQIIVKILSPFEKRKILISVKFADENLFPMQWIETGLFNLNTLVENRQNDYTGLEKVSLAHAVAEGLNRTGAPFKFRDDGAAGGKLYLYKVENNGLFSYGWGGKTGPPSTARAWVVRLNGKQYMNDFNKIFLADGDTVVIYHVSDILNPWIYSRLLSVNNSAGTMGEIEVLYEQSSCNYFNGIISETNFIPVSGEAIFAGATYFTGTDGKVRIQFDGNSPFLITSGNDAILFTEEITTHISADFNFFMVHPNPVEKIVYVNSTIRTNFGDRKLEIRIFNSSGNVLLEEASLSGDFKLNVSFLPPGIYYLDIQNGSKSEIHKIVKR